eukprot:4419087-Pleurochrysis_carterae.AAC.2
MSLSFSLCSTSLSISFSTRRSCDHNKSALLQSERPPRRISPDSASSRSLPIRHTLFSPFKKRSPATSPATRLAFTSRHACETAVLWRRCTISAALPVDLASRRGSRYLPVAACVILELLEVKLQLVVLREKQRAVLTGRRKREHKQRFPHKALLKSVGVRRNTQSSLVDCARCLSDRLSVASVSHCAPLVFFQPPRAPRLPSVRGTPEENSGFCGLGSPRVSRVASQAA